MYDDECSAGFGFCQSNFIQSVALRYQCFGGVACSGSYIMGVGSFLASSRVAASVSMAHNYDVHVGVYAAKLKLDVIG